MGKVAWLKRGSDRWECKKCKAKGVGADSERDHMNGKKHAKNFPAGKKIQKLLQRQEKKAAKKKSREEDQPHDLDEVITQNMSRKQKKALAIQRKEEATVDFFEDVTPGDGTGAGNMSTHDNGSKSTHLAGTSADDEQLNGGPSAAVENGGPSAAVEVQYIDSKSLPGKPSNVLQKLQTFVASRLHGSGPNAKGSKAEREAATRAAVEAVVAENVSLADSARWSPPPNPPADSSVAICEKAALASSPHAWADGLVSATTSHDRRGFAAISFHSLHNEVLECCSAAQRPGELNADVQERVGALERIARAIRVAFNASKGGGGPRAHLIGSAATGLAIGSRWRPDSNSRRREHSTCLPTSPVSSTLTAAATWT